MNTEFISSSFFAFLFHSIIQWDKLPFVFIQKKREREREGYDSFSTPHLFVWSKIFFLCWTLQVWVVIREDGLHIRDLRLPLCQVVYLLLLCWREHFKYEKKTSLQGKYVNLFLGKKKIGKQKIEGDANGFESKWAALDVRWKNKQ